MTQNILVGFHSNCNDGLGALAVVEHFLKGDGHFSKVGLNYSEERENDLVQLAKRNPIYDLIIFVDYCPTTETLDQLKLQRDNGATFKLIILDHHIHRASNAEYGLSLFNEEGDYIEFDNSRSGCGLAWDVLSEGQDRPFIVDLIEDRDLWIFKHGDVSRAAHIEVKMNGIKFIHDAINHNTLNFDKGLSIVNYEDKLIENIIRSHSVVQIKGIPVAILNVPSQLASQACSNLFDTTNYTAAISFAISGNRVNVSCRSIKESPITAIEIAKMYGGGGHNESAGCQMTLSQLNKLLEASK